MPASPVAADGRPTVVEIIGTDRTMRIMPPASDTPPVMVLSTRAAAWATPLPQIGTGPWRPPWATVTGIGVAVSDGDMSVARERALQQALRDAASVLNLSRAEVEARLRWIDVRQEAIGPQTYRATMDVAVEAEPYIPPPDARAGWDLVVPVAVRKGITRPFDRAWMAAWRRPGATSHDLAPADGDGEDVAILSGFDALDPWALELLRAKYGADHAWFAVLWEDDAPQVEFRPLDPAVLPGVRPLCGRDIHGDAVKAAFLLGVGTPPSVHPNQWRVTDCPSIADVALGQ